jgi:hypothetical protein
MIVVDASVAVKNGLCGARLGFGGIGVRNYLDPGLAGRTHPNRQGRMPSSSRPQSERNAELT